MSPHRPRSFSRDRGHDPVKIPLNGPPPAGHHASVTPIPMTMQMGAAEESADDDLVARLREGERDAVEQAYVAHHAAIRGFARRLVGDEASAEDIVHEAFVALPRAIRRFRGDGSLRAFLIGVAV